jgi:tRNA G18 (ribose-2'-O)-methylase SpoU
MENPMVNYNKIIAETAKNHYNVRDEFKNNTVEQNQFICHLNRRPFAVGCINITGELNVGMMIRSASLMGAETFYIFGRKKFDKRSTVGAENYINIVQYTFDDPLDADEQIAQKLIELQKRHLLVMCENGGVELGSPGIWTRPGTKERAREIYGENPPLFIFGSESHGIPQKVLDIPYRFIVSIPQVGVLRSFNVSAAMNIIVWDFIKEIYL